MNSLLRIACLYCVHWSDHLLFTHDIVYYWITTIVLCMGNTVPCEWLRKICPSLDCNLPSWPCVQVCIFSSKFLSHLVSLQLGCVNRWLLGYTYSPTGNLVWLCLHYFSPIKDFWWVSSCWSSRRISILHSWQRCRRQRCVM